MIACAFMTACAGGNSLPSHNAHRAENTAKATLTIRIPQTSASGRVREPHYISPGTKALQVNGWQSFNLSPSSPNCAPASGALVCTETVDLPIGNTRVSAAAFDMPLTGSGQIQGNQLSAGSADANIIEGTTNSVLITMLGTPGQVTITISNPSPPMGTAALIPVTLAVRDADGYPLSGKLSNGICFTTGVPLQFRVNGQPSSFVNDTSDRLAIDYSGHGFKSATIHAGCASGTAPDMGTATLVPVQAFSSELTVGTSLVGASASRDTNFVPTTLFTEPAKGKIGAYQGNGPITETPTATGGAPLRLFYSPLATLFTQSDNAIGTYIDIVGPTRTSATALPTANAGLYQIGGLTHPEMTAYFTEKNTGKIGALGLHVTEYPTGLSNSAPAGIAYRDGFSWWFADPGANVIGVITNSGAVTAYPVPTSGAQPTEITQSDGTMHWWFTEPGVSRIGKIDNSGSIVEYPSGAPPVAIVTSGSGDILVLTSTHVIEDYDATTGTYTTITPPVSAAGPVVGINDGNHLGDLILLRSDGTNGSIQEFYYE